MFEAGWSYYFQGTTAVVGLFHAWTVPNGRTISCLVYIWEADVYISKCHVDSARGTARFVKNFAIRPAVTKYLDANPDPSALYDAFVRGRAKMAEAAQFRTHGGAHRPRILRSVY